MLLHLRYRLKYRLNYRLKPTQNEESKHKLQLSYLGRLVTKKVYNLETLASSIGSVSLTSNFDPR